jgi:hypothetical protein
VTNQANVVRAQKLLNCSGATAFIVGFELGLPFIESSMSTIAANATDVVMTGASGSPGAMSHSVRVRAIPRITTADIYRERMVAGR